MKKPLLLLAAFLFLSYTFAQSSEDFSKQLSEKYLSPQKDLKLVVVTYDGCRWQEIFRGADKLLQKRLKRDDKLDQNFVTRISTGTTEEKRKNLSPFLWSTVAEKGIILGNADKGNTLYLANPYLFSYPGYSELFCGFVDRKVNSNRYPDNPNLTIADALQADSNYNNSIVVFSNWNAFPRILNTNRNKIPMFCNYASNDTTNPLTNTACIAQLSTNYPQASPYAEKDTAVYHSAKEYIVKNHPKVTFIGFDETDHFAHAGKYGAYIMAINQCDNFMNDLWNTLQSDPFYEDQTILIITCDHGRGNAVADGWRNHNIVFPASRHTWFAAIGPNVNTKGESKEITVNYHNQIAATIMKLLGKEYENPKHKVGKPIKEVLRNKE